MKELTRVESNPGPDEFIFEDYPCPNLEFGTDKNGDFGRQEFFVTIVERDTGDGDRWFVKVERC